MPGETGRGLMGAAVLAIAAALLWPLSDMPDIGSGVGIRVHGGTRAGTVVARGDA